MLFEYELNVFTPIVSRHLPLDGAVAFEEKEVSKVALLRGSEAADCFSTSCYGNGLKAADPERTVRVSCSLGASIRYEKVHSSEEQVFHGLYSTANMV